MTIASEITRLQGAKADICTAIENKGVTVADSVSLSDYCDCINAIQSGGLDRLDVEVQSGGYATISYPTNGSYGITDAAGGCKYTSGEYTFHCYTSDGFFIPLYNPGDRVLQYLVVGGGGAGGVKGGGGGGQVLCGTLVSSQSSFSIVVGCKGCYSCTTGGGSSCIGDIVVAKGGCKAPSSTGGASGSGCSGGGGYTSCAGGGGGGSTGAGCNGGYCGSATCYCGGKGGSGQYGYGGGGGGWSSRYRGCGTDGGGNGGCVFSCPTLPTNCGGGGGGHCTAVSNSNGAAGVVDICYPANGSYGFTCATGGTKSLCNGMCVHRFTSNGTFTIVS